MVTEIFVKRLAGDNTWQKFTTDKKVLSGSLYVDQATAQIRIDGGTATQLIANTPFPFVRFDISRFEFFAPSSVTHAAIFAGSW